VEREPEIKAEQITIVSENCTLEVQNRLPSPSGSQMANSGSHSNLLSKSLPMNRDSVPVSDFPLVADFVSVTNPP
jgi:hypothetical protein